MTPIAASITPIAPSRSSITTDIRSRAVFFGRVAVGILQPTFFSREIRKAMTKVSVLLVGVLLSSPLSAQELLCPNTGIPVSQDPGCMIPNNATGGTGYQVPAQQSPPQPKGYWETMWGAVALDAKVGQMGAAANMKSKDQAEAAAIADCLKRGGGLGVKRDLPHTIISV